jgi:hypothetical protein
MSNFKHLIDHRQPFKECTFQREGRPLRCKAQHLVTTGTSWETAASDYSGSTGRCREYYVYVTSGGNLVIVRKDLTQWLGELNRYYVYIFKNIHELNTFLDGLKGRAESYLIYELQRLSIDIAEEIE